MELMAAICTFALGRPVNLPPTVMPAPDEMLADLDIRSTDITILTLARHGMPLDMFHLVALGDMNSWARLTLREAALASGKVTAEQFDSIVKPINMIGDGLAGA
jgi:hypothetical protein